MKAHLPALDGLRALAIGLVFFRHLVPPFVPEGGGLLAVGPVDFAVPLINGWIGVDLFFVLSGYLICRQLLERQARETARAAWPGFMRRRLRRILPAYLALLLLTAAWLVLVRGAPLPWLGQELLIHLLFLQNYTGADLGIVLWSLGVEVQFYLLAPFLLALMVRRDGVVRWPVVACLALTPLLCRQLVDLLTTPIDDYVSFFRVYRSPLPMSADGLVAGMAVALYLHHDAAERRGAGRLLFWGGALLLLALQAGGDLVAHISWFDRVPLQSLIALGFAGLALGLLQGGGPSRFFAWPGWRPVSVTAYCLYLVHLPIIVLSVALVKTGGYQDSAPLVQLLLGLALAATLSGACALLLHLAVERPFGAMVRQSLRSPRPLG